MIVDKWLRIVGDVHQVVKGRLFIIICDNIDLMVAIIYCLQDNHFSSIVILIATSLLKSCPLFFLVQSGDNIMIHDGNGNFHPE